MEEKNKNIKEALIYLGIICFVILIRLFVISPIMVNGSSMSPVLSNNDIMILSKIDYTFNDISRFDIVVLEYNDDKLIKRIIAFPNETIEIRDNKLYINDRHVQQSFLESTVETYDFEKQLLPDDCYFVMGDNREDSLDSRIFGCVSKKDILGSANLVIFPFSHFGIKK